MPAMGDFDQIVGERPVTTAEMVLFKGEFVRTEK